MKGKYLITTDGWFYAPDGKQYRAVWGEVQILGDTVLGIKTNRVSTNWYALVGTNGREAIVAGCQIHYAVRCETKPNTEPVDDYLTDGGKHHVSERPTCIYIAE